MSAASEPGRGSAHDRAVAPSGAGPSGAGPSGAGPSGAGPSGAGPSGADPSGAGPELFRLVRFWSRRWLNRASIELTGEMRHVQHILTVEAVHTAETSLAGATIATVAHQLGLDHSGASRMVRDAATAGYLTRAADPRDHRRAALTLTPQGQALLAGSHQWQRQAFDHLTADWTDHDRRQLATYLHRLTRQLDLD
jgi:DNA-binding MarR family transcriptional regulator